MKESKLIDSQYAELLFYEECEEKNTLPLEIRKRIRSLMHYEVSTNPFIASIRVERTPTDLKYQLVTTSTGWFEYDPMTPVSLPPSPNQRNSWKNSVLQRVNTTLETARERLLSMSSEISETCDNR